MTFSKLIYSPVGLTFGFTQKSHFQGIALDKTDVRVLNAAEAINWVPGIGPIISGIMLIAFSAHYQNNYQVKESKEKSFFRTLIVKGCFQILVGTLFAIVGLIFTIGRQQKHL